MSREFGPYVSIAYQVFVEEYNRLTVLPSACSLETPPSSAEKKEVLLVGYYVAHYKYVLHFWK
jgi:hypothetical protein